MRFNQVVLFGRIAAEVEELFSGAASAVDYEFVAIAEHGAGPGEILFPDFWMMEVLEITRGDAFGSELRQRSRAFLQFRIYIGFLIRGSLRLRAAIPKSDRARSFYRLSLEQRF